MKNIIADVLLWLPVAMGGLFYAVVQLGHRLYQDGKIGVRGAIGIELVFLAISAFAFLVSIGVGIELWREGKRWGIACVVVSSVIAFMLFGEGFQCGSAILYAT
ncbi:MAG: hypothetical protein ACI9R3_001607 [Verrucomicrobiales bacterium]|jgi:hypothetical protein